MLDVIKKEIDQKIKELDDKISIHSIESMLLLMLAKSAKMPNSAEQYACLSSEVMNFILTLREERTISEILAKVSARIDQINT